MPLFQNESKCEIFHMKMSSTYSFIFMQIKVVFITMVSHFDSLGNGLFKQFSKLYDLLLLLFTVLLLLFFSAAIFPFSK